MSRILKRPMFRTGGTPNEGIMHGLVNRKGYKTAGFVLDERQLGTDTEAMIAALDKYAPIPKSKFPMGQIGLNLVSGKHSGEGFLRNLAGSAKEPYSQWTERDDVREQAIESRKGSAVTTAIGQQYARMKDDPNKALRNIYLTKAIDDGYDAPEANRIADYQVFTKTELQNKVGRELVGGILEFDLNDAKQTKKQLPKMKKDIGKYFYDPYDGKIKRLVEKNGVLGFLEFNSVEEIDLTAVEEGVSTVSSTPYADEQAAMEQEKGRGYLTDEDIFSQRFP